MVRIGLMRVDNPWINLAVAVILFLIAFIYKGISEQAQIVVILAGIVLLGRAGVTFFYVYRQKESRVDRFARFAEEDKQKNLMNEE